MKHLLSNPNLTRLPLLVPFWLFSFTSSSASQAPCDLEASAQGLLHCPLPMARLPCHPTDPTPPGRSRPPRLARSPWPAQAAGENRRGRARGGGAGAEARRRARPGGLGRGTLAARGVFPAGGSGRAASGALETDGSREGAAEGC